MLGNQKVATSDTNPNGVPVDYQDAIQMLMNRYDAAPAENNEENLESYSIRAKKFKEIQFLRGTYLLYSTPLYLNILVQK